MLPVIAMPAAEPIRWAVWSTPLALPARWLVKCRHKSVGAGRHNRTIAEGREDDYSNTWSLLFDAGGDARVNGIPFAEERTAPWKEGWIEADINLGVHGVEEQ